MADDAVADRIGKTLCQSSAEIRDSSAIRSCLGLAKWQSARRWQTFARSDSKTFHARSCSSADLRSSVHVPTAVRAAWWAWHQCCSRFRPWPQRCAERYRRCAAAAPHCSMAVSVPIQAPAPAEAAFAHPSVMTADPSRMCRAEIVYAWHASQTAVYNSMSSHHRNAATKCNLDGTMDVQFNLKITLEENRFDTMELFAHWLGIGIASRALLSRKFTLNLSRMADISAMKSLRCGNRGSSSGNCIVFLSISTQQRVASLPIFK